MSNVAKRVEQAEKRLGLDQGAIVVNLIWFGGEPVPPEEHHDNLTIRYVAYESLQAAAGEECERTQ